MATKLFTKLDCATPGITPTAAPQMSRNALAIARKNSPMMCRDSVRQKIANTPMKHSSIRPVAICPGPGLSAEDFIAAEFGAPHAAMPSLIRS